MAAAPASILIFAIVAGLAMGEPDPCAAGNHRELDDWQRSTGYVMAQGDTPKCDHRLAPAWYRFTSMAGGKMPEEAPEQYHCGTPGPIWLNGTHPGVNEDLVARMACVNSGGPGWRAEHGCAHSVTIGVKNCGSFFVYFLQPPQICPISYCAGSGSKCPPGTGSATGFTPCAKLPDPAHVTLSNPHVDSDSFHFTCDVTPPSPRDPNTVFEVQFLFDGKPDPSVPVDKVQGSNTQAVLLGSKLKNHMGSHVSCRVRSYLANQAFVAKTNWTTSNSYWAGIKTTPHVTCSEKGGGVNVTVTSTVPVMCQSNQGPTCCLRLSFDARGPPDNLMTTSPCDQQLCSHHWDPVTNSAAVNISVAAAKDNIKDGDNNMTLTFDHLDPGPGDTYTDIFTGYRPPNATVSVKDGRVHICSWTGDPHFTDFGGKRFDIYDAGDFTMYENKQDNFEMHARFIKCRNAACECGLVIHEGNDVIRIDSCASPTHAPSVRTNGQLRPGTRIEQTPDGKHIMVYLPSGREVKVDAGSHYHNVHLTVPPTDAGRGRGVCGSLEANEAATSLEHRDGRHRSSCNNPHCRPSAFFNTWKNHPSTSLFESVPPLVNESRTDNFCTCDKNTNSALLRTNCTKTAVTHLAQKCSASPCRDVTNKLPSILQGSGWTRRQAHYVDTDQPDPPVDFTSTPSSSNASFPTPSGITKAQATAACLAASQASQLYSLCHVHRLHVLGSNRDNCVQDVMIMDSLDIVESAAQAMTSLCQFQLLQDPSNYVTGRDGKLLPKPALSQEICSEACLKNGRCVKGVCVCNTGYTGVSCQFQANTPPTLVRIRGSKQCDMQQRPCRKAWFDAEHFQATPTFRCRVKATQMDGSQVFTKDIDAEFISGGRLACPLPDVSNRAVTTLRVKVTMDGVHYSNAQALTVFDSSCMACTAGGCRQKAGTCWIEEKCFQNNDVKPGDKTKYCNASTSTTAWSAVSTAPLFPTIGKPVLTGPDSDFLMHCAVNVHTYKLNARYRVTWYTDNDDEVGSVVLPPDSLVSEFNLVSLPSAAKQIYCRVRPFFEGQSQYGPAAESEHKAVTI